MPRLVFAMSAMLLFSAMVFAASNPMYAPAVSYGVGSDPSSITVADFNGDSKADIAVANAGSGSVSVLLGNGNGVFQPAASFAVGSGPFSINRGDFNGDGKVDLVVVNQTTD